MAGSNLLAAQLSAAPSPCYIAEEALLRKNISIIQSLIEQSGCEVLLALKGFAMFSTFPILQPTIAAASASSLNEALLGRQMFNQPVHIYSPAYKEDEFEQILSCSSHVTFNSFSQLARFKADVLASGAKAGLRLNPETAEVATAIYNPCMPFSRLGITRGQFRPAELSGVTGFHFHNLCESGAASLQRTLKVIERNFGKFIYDMEWVNFGGGHHITRADYDVELLVSLIKKFKQKYKVQVILEPGEAVALNAGYLLATVLDVVHNGMNIAILDASATTHMPDVLEMPYRAEIIGAGRPDEFKHSYRLAGCSCLAGDIIGDYSFKKPLQIGDRLLFADMLHYSMVKNTTFNGVNLPSIGIYHTDGSFELIKSFGFEDYKNRLS